VFWRDFAIQHDAHRGLPDRHNTYRTIFQKGFQDKKYGRCKAPDPISAPNDPILNFGGTFWTKFELFLKKIRTLNFDCRASLGRAENFSAGVGREEKGVWGK
jgi:hypothetical protein